MRSVRDQSQVIAPCRWMTDQSKSTRSQRAWVAAIASNAALNCCCGSAVMPKPGESPAMSARGGGGCVVVVEEVVVDEVVISGTVNVVVVARSLPEHAVAIVTNATTRTG